MNILPNRTIPTAPANEQSFAVATSPLRLDKPSVETIAGLPIPFGVYTAVKNIGKNRFDATVYDAQNTGVSNIAFSVVNVGNKPAVRIDTRTNLQGGGVDTFALASVAKWAEENGISQVVAFGSKPTAEWYKKPPRSFAAQTGVDSEGKTFNLISKNLGILTNWILGKDIHRQ
jgi:hypothetical protein